jgi:UDP-N-acetylmuramoyl-L-alanyl-D-glutamate--2,6-diaminopimelate ligase
MRLRELLAEVPGAEVAGSVEIDISGVDHDSRATAPGSLFVCIRGFKQDGHTFIGDAARRGAAAVVVEDDPARLAIPPGLTVVRVVNSRLALARLAGRFFGHPSRQLRLIGITGTNGKTTSAHLVEAILRAAGHRVGLLGTIEYRCGATAFPGERTTPEASDLQRLLARMRDMGAWGAAMEVSSHSLTLHRVEACEFDVAVFTNLTQDHLDFHGSMERYAEAKARLFQELGKARIKPGMAAAVLNADDPWSDFMAQQTTARVVRFSLTRDTDLSIRSAEFGLAGIRASVGSPWGAFQVVSPLVGRHNLANILGAAGACLQLGIPCPVVEAGVANLHAVPGRFEKVEAGQPFGVAVDYAHTPDALERVLTFAREYTRGRLIVVFGCGGDRDRGKRPRMGEVATRLADAVVVTSDNPRSEDPETILQQIVVGIKKTFADVKGHVTITDRREAIGAALASARGGDLVVIAGKGHETYQILRDRTIPFDDRVVAREALTALGYGAPGSGPTSEGR